MTSFSLLGPAVLVVLLSGCRVRHRPGLSIALPNMACLHDADVSTTGSVPQLSRSDWIHRPCWPFSYFNDDGVGSTAAAEVPCLIVVNAPSQTFGRDSGTRISTSFVHDSTTRSSLKGPAKALTDRHPTASPVLPREHLSAA
nr:hypothetical protein CFP56_10223 [Quercus suber]